ncbi:hypothetical protein [Paenibacillus pedocola]|uniref:hypothetical protein n=1 Tax=Paenibacillus pedocola TaxID=3242193 RepID=UPI0028778CE5|nr:hypothetical protein [Paenibacillus typhae]
MPSWIVVAIFYSFMSCWTFGFIHRFRSNLTSTITMISPMVSGMIIGIGGGTITGILYEQNLLLSLFISVIIGMTAGGIIGALISIGAFLNGALSGMMAGMMGVMLMNMLPSSQWGKGIFAFMVIGAILQFVHMLMLQGQIQETLLRQSSWMYRSPVLMMFVTVTLLSIFTFGRFETTLTDSNSIQMPKQTEQSPMNAPNGRHMAQ